MNDFELASLLARVYLTQEEKETVHIGLNERKTHVEQTHFFQYCKDWKLAPLVYTQIVKYAWESHFEVELLELYKDQYQKVKIQNEKRNKRAVEFLKAFKEEGIDVIVLKGNYLAHKTYEKVGYKRMNDFDILIKKEDWDRIQDVYLRLGYIPLGFGWSTI